MENNFNINEKIIELSKIAIEKCKDQFTKIDKIKEYNEQKMLKAFQNANVNLSSFSGSNGYGYDDVGRDKLDQIYSYVFDSEDSLVRHNFVSGTHTLSVALFGILRPGDKVLCITGEPYDTLLPVIGIKEGSGSLKEFGIEFDCIDLSFNDFDYDEITNKLKSEYKMIYIQRSKGYSTRYSITIEKLEKVTKYIRNLNKDIIIFLDNCYGEFIDYKSPISVGVDLMAGSLIKNAGGGISQTGGYITGKKELVEMCSYRLTTPSTGKEIGCTLNTLRDMYLGAYFAPISSAEALKTSVFASCLFELLDFDVTPKYNEDRGDIVEVIFLQNKENIELFCKGIQKGSFIDSSVIPSAAPMPGYDNDVIMASGSFTLGSSIELSADAPIRKPYCVYLQGGLSFNTSKVGIMIAASNLIK